MASIVWDRDPQEAMENPYEYNCHKQFSREALKFVDLISQVLFGKKDFTVQEQTLEKALWMLQTDALFAFKDCVELLDSGRHRLVGRLLRDILESTHLVEYFSSETEKAKSDLRSWYNDEPIMHKEYRRLVEKTAGEQASNAARHIHRVFSKFTHRTYKTLLYGYYLGRDGRIIYDYKYSLVPTLSMYYALVGAFGLHVIENLKQFGNLSTNEVEAAWLESMEEFQIPRGYLSEDDLKFFRSEE